MDYQEIAKILIGLKDADLALRDILVQSGQLFDGYHPEMEQKHLQNADILNQIIDRIGYPTKDKVGEEACEAAWLVIQHAISRPAFMITCKDLLEEAVAEKKAEPKYLAYLTDRIAILSDKPQLYGTQFDWDDNGVLSPNRHDDLDKVNNRRKTIGLNSLEEQTILIRNRAKVENQSYPVDFEKRKLEYEAWRKRVGWVK
jgi:hypothetical protein